MSEHAHVEEHFAGTNKLFISIWVWLLVLTLIEIFLAYKPMPIHFMLTILLGLSIIKAALIIAYFMTIGLGHYLSVAAILFTLGIFGIFLNRKNVIIILMSIELILLAVNINLVAFSTHLGDIVGQIYALLVLTVAAAEAAIGLAILVVFYRNRGSIAVEDINLMRG